LNPADPVYLASILGSLFVFALIAVAFFNRDPDRTVPSDADAIVSPADGKIVYVRRIDGDEIPWTMKGRKRISLVELTKSDFSISAGYILGIYMSLFDVHVNRSPIGGEVVKILRVAGRLARSKDPSFEFQNCRVVTAIRHTLGFLIVTIQIGVMGVGKIDSFLKEGTIVRAGDKIGRIRLGSQVDVIIPDLPRLRLLVKEGNRVRAGSSIIARFAAVSAN
jgi:phosphatidylserine decarboxylase